MKEFDKNMAAILEIDLALEDYEDDTGKEYTKDEKKIFDDLKLLRKEKNTMEEQELIIRSKDILSKLNKLLDKIGREKFIFYNDGDINYKWNGGKNDGWRK